MRQHNQLLEDSKSYLKTKYDLLRLELLDKLSVIMGRIVLIIVAIFITLAAIAYFSVALVGWLGNVMSVSTACCIIGGLLLVTLLILYLLRERLFINPFVKLFSGIIFQKPEELPDTEENTAAQTPKMQNTNEADV